MSIHAIVALVVIEIKIFVLHNTYLELNFISMRFKLILGAVSTTGIGECLMRSLCANEIALCMGRQKLMPNTAIKTTIDNMNKSIGGDGKY